MQRPECRVDRLAYGRVHIADIMSMPRHHAPDLSVDAPAFPVSREEALRIIRERAAREPGAIAFLSKEALKPRDLVLRLGELTPADGPRARGSWVSFIDLVPEQSFAHRCLYLFIDPDRGVREARASWFPENLQERFARVA